MSMTTEGNPLPWDPAPEEELACLRRIFLDAMLPKSKAKSRSKAKPKPRPAPTLESLQREVDELRKEIEKIHQGMFAASMDAALSR